MLLAHGAVKLPTCVPVIDGFVLHVTDDATQVSLARRTSKEAADLDALLLPVMIRTRRGILPIARDSGSGP